MLEESPMGRVSCCTSTSAMCSFLDSVENVGLALVYLQASSQFVATILVTLSAICNLHTLITEANCTPSAMFMVFKPFQYSV